MAEHRWKVCEMCGPMVICGHCGNNCCNGGSNDGCPDKCDSAYALQKAENPPAEVTAEWERMKQAGETWQQRYDNGTLFIQRSHENEGEK